MQDTLSAQASRAKRQPAGLEAQAQKHVEKPRVQQHVLVIEGLTRATPDDMILNGIERLLDYMHR